MPRLTSFLSSDYLSAANALNGRGARRKITAYVESYDDVHFWRSILSQMETAERCFQVLLPYRHGGRYLERGKKAVLMSAFKEKVGPEMIACVDADYDYLKQNPDNEFSAAVCHNPYVFHTYAYAIENLQCWAPTLHEVCVMATLADNPAAFNFERFLADYSTVVYPLFVWSVLSARNKQHASLEMNALLATITPGKINPHNAARALTRVKHNVDVRLRQLQQDATDKALQAYEALDHELRQLGVTPETTYMYIQGHFVFSNIVVPLLDAVAKELTDARRQEIAMQSKHETQRQNETACYEHSIESIPSMLRKHTFYLHSPFAQRILADLKKVYKT